MLKDLAKVAEIMANENIFSIPASLTSVQDDATNQLDSYQQTFNIPKIDSNHQSTEILRSKDIEI